MCKCILNPPCRLCINQVKSDYVSVPANVLLFFSPFRSLKYGCRESYAVLKRKLKITSTYSLLDTTHGLKQKALWTRSPMLKRLSKAHHGFKVSPLEVTSSLVLSSLFSSGVLLIASCFSISIRSPDAYNE